MKFKFNINAQRFIDEKGRFVKETKVIEALGNYRIQKQVVVDRILQKYLEQDVIDYESLLKELSGELKNLWFVNYVVGKGGVKNLNNDDIGILNAELKRELTTSFDSLTGRSYGLEELLTQHELSEISTNELTARVRAYVRGSKKAYWQASDRRQTQPYMQRFLNGDNNCEECIQYANVGMVKKGQLPLPGDMCSCRSNCNCTVNYYSEKQYKQYLKTQIANFADSIYEVS